MSTLAELAMGSSRGTGIPVRTPSNILEFIEAPWGLNPNGTFNLFPVQRIVLKAHYGLALDENPYGFDLSAPVPKTHTQYDPSLVDVQGHYKYGVPVTDWRKENRRVLTEAEYLAWIHSDGRCNISVVTPGVERREMLLSIGRRSGKTTISACVAAYETYKLICKGNPQAYYGIPNSNNIQIISVATDRDQAGLLYQEASGHFKQCDFFSPYTANNTQSYARFQTPYDVHQFGTYKDDKNAKATVRVTFRSCIATGLRGAGNIVVILDEFAHFKDAGQSSGNAVYDAVTPSTSAFSPKDPRDSRVPIGDSEGRIIVISSPLGRDGPFYELFQVGMTNPRAGANMLCVEAPTWEVNPTLPAAEYEKHYAKNPAVFFTEFGAKFSDRTRGWIESEDELMACVNEHRRPTNMGEHGVAHYLGLDIGFKGDGTAAAIGHMEGDLFILDAVETIKAGEGANAHLDRLDFEGVADWVVGLTKRWRIEDGVFDQYHGIAFEQALRKRGVKQLRSVHMTQTLNSQIFNNFKSLMWAKRLMLYNWPLLPGQIKCDYIQELLELQAEYKSEYAVKVAAPNAVGKHDDRSDAIVRMVWCAAQASTKVNHIVGAARNAPPGAGGPRRRGLSRNARMKAQMGGSHPSRMVAKTVGQARRLQLLKGR